MATMVEAKTVKYTWTLKSRCAQAKDLFLSPDCNLERIMLLVNGQFPGPAIKANAGGQ